VKRTLLRTTAFVHAARKSVRKHPEAADDLRTALTLLSEDAFQARLRTHKLKGKMEGYWACSAGYDLRIVFRFARHKGSEAVLLETVGTHEEVY